MGPLTESDDRDAAPVAVIGYRLWQRAFGGDPGIVGRPLRIGSVGFTIVGVLSRTFDLHALH